MLTTDKDNPWMVPFLDRSPPALLIDLQQKLEPLGPGNRRALTLMNIGVELEGLQKMPVPPSTFKELEQLDPPRYHRIANVIWSAMVHGVRV